MVRVRFGYALGAALALPLALQSASAEPVEGAINAPVLSVYDDGFRLADDTQVYRVDAWNLCGDRTREHIRRRDVLTVQGEREWRFMVATSITREDGTPACPPEDAPDY